ncbi:MAG: UDP-glucose 4-epimerase GalE [Endozoicomonas sp.]
MSILVTGGAGYIGSHTCLELLNAGYDVVVVDNLCNSHEVSIRRVAELTGKAMAFYPADIRDRKVLTTIFQKHDIEAVIHFAGLKAVGESTKTPLAYFDNNVSGTINLLEIMESHDVRHLVFSSSATVYGNPHDVPIREDFPVGAVTNPYGRSKYMVEEILRDTAASNEHWNFSILRYFNPVGAHESGMIGEDPSGIPNNLIPYIAQVAVCKLEHLNVFGDDYPTPDGTGIRDYIHVVDLALGHLAAVKKHWSDSGVHTYNLGTGIGSSVMDMLHAFEKACKKPLPYKIQPRRKGDIAQCFADPTYAKEKLGWKANRSIEEMTLDVWRWQSKNPNGFRN